MSLALLDTAPTLAHVDEHAASWLLTIRSPRTRTEYRRDLRDWLAWCHGHGLDPYLAQRGHVDGWARSMEAAGAAPASVKRRVTAVRGWYDHLLHDLELVTRNPVQRVKTPPARHRPRLSYGPKVIAAMAARAQAAHYDPQAGTRAQTGIRGVELAFRLMAVNGLRVEETACIPRTAVTATGTTRVLQVPGKAGRWRIAVLDPRSRALVDEIDGDTLTPSKPTIQRWVRVWAAQVGAPELRCHDLRHWAATTLLSGDVPLHVVQDFMGHADPKTTRVYDRDAGILARDPSHLLAVVVDGGELERGAGWSTPVRGLRKADGSKHRRFRLVRDSQRRGTTDRPTAQTERQ